MAGHSEQPIAVYGGIAANLLIAIAKFIAGYFSGSSAMIAEGVHSVVDTGNQSLLLLGIHRSRKPADDKHPYGYGKELYFWSLIVAVVLFGLGGGISIYEGVNQLTHPKTLGDPTWSYVVLGIAFVAEGGAGYLALRELLKTAGEKSFWHALRSSKDPAVFTILGEDFAALLGVVVAFGGIYLGRKLGNPYFDGIASIIIGLILALVAVFLVYESKGLIIGEAADPEVVKSIREIAQADPAVVQVANPLTLHFGPDQVLLNMHVEFHAPLSLAELTATIDRLQTRIRERHPAIRHIFIESEALRESAETTRVAS
jgi:cation diffusion facilitator family transporter